MNMQCDGGVIAFTVLYFISLEYNGYKQIGEETRFLREKSIRSELGNNHIDLG